MSNPHHAPGAVSPAMARLGRAAAELALTYPAPAAPKEPTWHPAPWVIPPAAQQLAERVPPYA